MTAVAGQPNMKEGRFPVVGVGASAGGLEAFRALFENMPSDCGMAFVMILHLPPDRRSMLTEIITRWTRMPVIEATDGMRIECEHVYVPPPHALVELHGGVFRVQPVRQGERLIHPIDEFFDSLGTDLGERAVGIVLSGTGNDGSLGLKALKERGGLTIAQGTDGSGPQHESMPAGAIATGTVDIVSPVEDMPAHLLRLGAGLADVFPATEGSTDIDSARLEICALLRAHLDHDFSDYRSQTFLRRVARRMQVLNIPTLERYIGRLKEDSRELTALFRDLLIRVTSFFRDPETFKLLADKIIPRLFEKKTADGVVRIWVPGCATGEEAYSFAILLSEHMATLQVVPKVQVFATDIDDAAITIARMGRYPATLVDGLSPERLQRFFLFSQGSYAVRREIRNLCTFSVHNVIRDPPFSMMSMVSCRNLLIYMNPTLQARIPPIFHYALAPAGMLLLGGSESVSQHTSLFEVVDKTARIFQKRGNNTPELHLSWQRPLGAGTHPFNQAAGIPPQPGLHDHQVHLAQGREPPPGVPLLETRFHALAGQVEPTGENIRQLQGALTQVCEELQSLTEEHQTAIEELRSANEELHSVNEEMQSANEELETSKEELQSLNEELHTVNLRLTEKVDELDQANSDLRNLFDSTDIATVFLDRHLIIRSFTPAIAAVYNLIPTDQGRSLADIVSRVRYPTLREDVAYVLSSLEPLERRLVSENRLAHYILRIVPYREPDSTVTGVLVTFIDVSSIVKAEEALVEADVRKDQFLATLSHELRNPLSPIRTAAELLQSPQLQPEQMRHVQSVITRQVAHMSSLLDDLLDVSRITRAAFSLKKAYVDLQHVMDAAIEAVQPALNARHHELRLEPLPVPVVLEVDGVRMTQVLTNLLTNAVKYTPPGGLIQVGARFDAPHLVVFVRDNGIGLTPESMGRVFEMFTRIDSVRAESGLGIGLALAKGLMELHGGSLRVQSAGLGSGSEFQMLIPLALVVADAPPPQATEENHAAVKARRILVADDNVDSATTLAMLLRLAGHDTHLAHSGAETLEQMRRLKPDVCICDIGMPGMNGYEVAERVRQEAWGRDVKLIAVTGWGQEADRRRSLAAGFDLHLTKPVDPAELEKLIDS
ncbi:MAG TPA: CheR family methyltransferase [Steroidobacteraceae bacterium]|nr:CheR family methyltransferase [Steroidobacteraceae bacterium]